MKANKSIDQLIDLLNVYKDTATEFGIHSKGKSRYTASIEFEPNSYKPYFIHADGIGMTIMSLRKFLGQLCNFANVKLDFPVDNELFWLDGFTQDWEFYRVEGENDFESTIKKERPFARKHKRVV
ncbi:hypothetical protein Sps_00064 [Shewanella psychrophila]|uniref:Uncharacterized protein n=1 Tax=Shewanella psychrophila TaxID=225848 RepID=A0A1S6HIE8_9GAMM|nr:hypothetical protein [Shewanella psychrophila]AQS35289.1 hypothetical protein Sps_00064 [Shewanella psychrophila]